MVSKRRLQTLCSIGVCAILIVVFGLKAATAAISSPDEARPAGVMTKEKAAPTPGPTPDSTQMDCGDCDGYTEEEGDCDEADSSIYPGAEEVPYDGVDQDCNGTDLTDVDGDGYHGGPGGDDCDDQNEEVHPGQYEIPYDGVDQDCKDGDSTDLDDDGYEGGPDGDDCDDFNAEINPSQVDIAYDGVDQDCDGEDGRDEDLDGFDPAPYGDDCDDTNAAVHPGADEVCKNEVDEDCDGFDVMCPRPTPDATPGSALDPSAPPSGTLDPNDSTDASGCQCASRGPHRRGGGTSGWLWIIAGTVFLLRRASCSRHTVW